MRESSVVMCCVLPIWYNVQTNFWVDSQPASSLFLAQCSQLLIVLIISYSIHKPWKLPLSLHLQLHHCAQSSLSLFIHQTQQCIVLTSTRFLSVLFYTFCWDCLNIQVIPEYVLVPKEGDSSPCPCGVRENHHLFLFVRHLQSVFHEGYTVTELQITVQAPEQPFDEKVEFDRLLNELWVPVSHFCSKFYNAVNSWKR